VRLVLKAVASACILAIPALGVWSASSLAAYADGPIEATIAAGLLLFPGLPLAWEALAARKRARAGAPRKAILTFGDRLILRTFALNALFVGGFLFLRPEAIFVALSTRGDWFLERVEGAEGARRAVLAAADGLVFLYEAAHDNPHAREETDDDAVPDPEPGGAVVVSLVPDPPPPRPTPPATDAVDPEPPGVGVDPQPPAVDVDPTPPAEAVDPSQAVAIEAPTPAEAAAEEDEPPVDDAEAPRWAWPLPDVAHPLVATMPKEAEASIASVGAYLASVEDPFERAKAVHDYVATRVVYDVEALRTRRYPPQNPRTVFRTRRGVCAGYAQLFKAIAHQAGLRATYVVGDSRTGEDDDGTSAAAHAWNAVELEGAWYLVDVTWDAGYVDDRGFHPKYGTAYFLTPPEAFGRSHFPDRKRWQLREQPLTRGEFYRQPLLLPGFDAAGLTLVDPDRFQIEIVGDFDARLESALGRRVLAEIRVHGADASAPRTRCEVSGTTRLSVHCDLPREGRYDVRFYTGLDSARRFDGVGTVQVVRR
jgi:transglutaminase-like putative cysteine protease